MASAALAPLEREVIRCFSCLLNQFMPKNKHCRKCKVNLAPKPEFTVTLKFNPDPFTIAIGDHRVGSGEIGNATALPAEVFEVSRPAAAYSPQIRMDLAVFVLRHRLNLSQRDLAKRLNKPRTYISKVEGSKAQPTLATISQLAAGLEVTPYQLIDMASV